MKRREGKHSDLQSADASFGAGFSVHRGIEYRIRSATSVSLGADNKSRDVVESRIDEAEFDPVLHRRRNRSLVRTLDSPNPRGNATNALIDQFRCPPDVGDFVVSGDLSGESGYFGFGPDAICFGQCSSGAPAKFMTGSMHDARQHIGINESSIHLPFDPAQVVDNLRCERYSPTWTGVRTLSADSSLRSMYYLVRPLLGVSVRRNFQKMYLRGWDKIPFPRWPVDTTVESILEQLLALSMKSKRVTRLPFIWFWPDGIPSCTMMTHDVETSAGLKFCSQLMDLNDSFGIKSSFQIIPEKRYTVSGSALENIWARGFEVNVHDLDHRGNLMNNRGEFLSRVQRINAYGRRLGAQGFRSALMNRNTDWHDALDFSYDMSIPNVAHLEPQQGGCCTVFPFFIGKILELPLTTIQDYSLFNILDDYSTRLWKEQISLIRRKSGLISFIVHPDYIISQAAQRVYADLLHHLCELRSRGETWIALPGEIAAWWRLRTKLSLVNEDGSWRIQGAGSERARLAYAVLNGDRISYELAPAVV
jgi:hypothetical protein